MFLIVGALVVVALFAVVLTTVVLMRKVLYKKGNQCCSVDSCGLAQAVLDV